MHETTLGKRGAQSYLHSDQSIKTMDRSIGIEMISKCLVFHNCNTKDLLMENNSEIFS